MAEMIIKKVQEYMKQQNMLEGCSHIVVGLSGGADSVCLLRVLCTLRKQYPYRLTAVHVNHGIRGAEALRDQNFSAQLCKELGVECFVCTADVQGLAKKEGISVEEAGRRVRYESFFGFAGETSKIAVGHHMEDEAETVLFHIFRGCGIKGAGGIAPVRDRIIRPLLCVTRREITDYLTALGQPYMTDSTNLQTDYSRNKIRREILPQLQEHFNPNIVRGLCAMAREMRETEAYLEELTSCAMERCMISDFVLKAEAFLQCPKVLQRRIVLRLCYRMNGGDKDLYRGHVEAVVALAAMPVGKSVDLPHGIRAVKDYDTVIFTKGQAGCESEVRCLCSTEKPIRQEWAVPDLHSASTGGAVVAVEEYIYAGSGLYRKCVIEFAVLEKKRMENAPDTAENGMENPKNSNNDYTKYFDYDKIRNDLSLRFRRENDRLVINRRGESKPFQRELIDRKIPKKARDRILLLTEGSNVLWAVGVRRCEDYYIGDTTQRVLKIQVCFKEDERCEATPDSCFDSGGTD